MMVFAKVTVPKKLRMPEAPDALGLLVMVELGILMDPR